MTVSSTLARVNRLKAMKRERESQVLRHRAKKQAEAQLDRDRRGSTDRPQLSDFWTPNPGPQAAFFHSTCQEILYGGQAGGGKSAALTALPLKWAHEPGFLSLTLRRTYPQGRQLRRYSRQLYRSVFPGLKPIKSEGFLWSFPSGAEASYGHCQHEDSHENYDGWEINLLCFDELTHFTEEQYTYLFARVRTSNPRLPTYIRATTNPGGEGHDWVFRRWGAWLNPEFTAEGLPTRRDAKGNKLPPAKPGEVWWIHTADGVETYHRKKVPGSKSRTFIPAELADNPHLDDEYRANLEQLDAVRRAQLRDGNWLIRPAAGLYFRREWVTFIDASALPAGIRWVRNWDLAATMPTKSNKDPDWTRGVKIGMLGPTIFIADVASLQDNPGAVAKLIKSTAEMDGHAVPIGIPQDPGQAGKDQVANYVKMLVGFTVLAETENGDKATRFSSFSTQAEHGNVVIVRGPWNEAYISELEAFPTPKVKDDQVDATSGGFRRLTSGAGRFLAAMAAEAARNEKQ